MKLLFAVILMAALAQAQEKLPAPPKPALKATPPQPLPEPPKPDAPLTSRDAAESLSEEELRQVIDLLRENYIRPDAASEINVARASVQGMLDRLGTGVRIYSKRAATTGQPSLFRSEILDGGTAYLRLGALTASNIDALDRTLAGFGAKPPASAVLDLRATPHHADFELAAEVCRRFVPKGRVLFSIKRPKANDEEILTSRDDPRWRGLLVVLVDGDTAGSAEVIAAVLRTHLRAYVAGQKTLGEAAQFDDLPLPGGKILRVAVGEVTLPDATQVFPGGLTPDLVVALDQAQSDAALAAAEEKGVTPLVVEKERPRMNEAALVAGTNPELDAAQERQKAKANGEEPKAQTRDIVLQRALDYITTVRVIEAGRAKRK